jgi:hypothetical protein
VDVRTITIQPAHVMLMAPRPLYFTLPAQNSNPRVSWCNLLVRCRPDGHVSRPDASLGVGLVRLDVIVELPRVEEGCNM